MTEVSEGFHERVQREALEESKLVLADLERLRFRADQVLNVLRALKLPVPSELSELTAEPVTVEHEIVQPESQPTVEKAEAQRELGDKPKTRPPAAPVPEHLRDMPAARKGTWRPTIMLSVAERQLRVYEDVKAHPDSLVPELADRLGEPRERVQSDATELVRSGMLEVTGRRLPKGNTRGRHGHKLRVTERGPDPTTSVRSQDADPVVTAGKPVSGQVDQALVNLVRAAFYDREGKQVEPASLARKLGLSVHKVIAASKALHEAGALERHGTGGAGTTYAWHKPAETGRGNPRRNGTTRSEHSGSLPVAGTGRPTRANNAEVNALLADCRSAGATVEHASGHFIVKWRGMQGIVRAEVRSTPGGDARQAVEFDRQKLRRRGLKV